MLTGSYLVDATVDSGAAASVCPAETFSEYDQEQADEQQHFVAANGELVPELSCEASDCNIRRLCSTDAVFSC